MANTKGYEIMTRYDVDDGREEGDDARANPLFRLVLTPRGVAEGLNLTVQTLGQYRAKGIGPVYSKAGGRIYYLVADVIRWIEDHRVGATAEAA
jgi:hypothetical protein